MDKTDLSFTVTTCVVILTCTISIIAIMVTNYLLWG